jgi:SAM-dependent methyltransferase
VASLYEALAKRVPTLDWAFMNYGYAPATVDANTPPLRSRDEQDRLCIQVYLHAIDNCDLRGRDVLEVGSGRGGGASYISRLPAATLDDGVGFPQEAVDLCNRYRLAPGLAFVCGDAQSMPFPASSFDAVVNIESSHCYESMDTFSPRCAGCCDRGGRLFFADLRSTDGVNTLREQFNASGLTVEKETDITNQRSDRAASGQCPEAGAPEHVSEEWGHQSGQADVKRRTCAPIGSGARAARAPKSSVHSATTVSAWTCVMSLRHGVGSA